MTTLEIQKILANVKDTQTAAITQYAEALKAQLPRDANWQEVGILHCVAAQRFQSELNYALTQSAVEHLDDPIVSQNK